MIKTIQFLIIFSFFIILSSQSFACSSCFASNTPEQMQSYVQITILLTVLPLTLIGGLVFWVYKNNKKNEKEEEHG